MTVSRRVFVRAGGLAMVSLGLDPMFLTKTAFAARRSSERRSSDRPVLVCLFLRGAADGLSMIVPYGDPGYYQARPRLAIPVDDVLDLDGHFGLHPALSPLKPLWDDRMLAVVHAVGSPAVTRSHFDAQAFMESGTPGRKATPDGWLNRYLRHHREHRETPFRSVAFGPELPKILSGQAPGLTIDRAEATGLLATSAKESLEAVRTLKAVNPTRPSNSPRYPDGTFGQSLLQVAQLIKADVGVEIAFADMGGWDTHFNQGTSDGHLATRLRELALGLAAFARDLGTHMHRVVVLTMSEFGRTVEENGSAGTDHGHGTAMMLVGGPVRGGHVLGTWPGLAVEDRFEKRDLAVTTDFRDFFGEVVVRHLGATDLTQVFPGHESAGFPGAIRD